MSPKSVFFFVVVLLTVSTMTLVSISTIKGEEPITDPWKGFVEVSFRLMASFVVFLVFSNVDYRIHKDQKIFWTYYAVLMVSLILVLILPSHGTEAKRWIKLGNLSVQPSEFVKIYVIAFLARYLESVKNEIRKFVNFLKPLAVLSPMFIAIAFEPDMSTALIIVLLSLLILYAGGAKLFHVLLVIGLVVITVLFLFQSEKLRGYQIERLRSFIRGNISEQTLMALESIKSGGFVGKGVVMGDVKLLVPAVESDFILAIVGEELGYLGIAIVLVAYLGLVYSLVKIAERFVEDVFARMFIVGYSYLIVLQVAVNLGVNAGILPVTGIPLPFLSHGGSSLMSFMLGLGIITNAVYGRREEEE